MSYVSILKNIPDFLSQPAGIAAVASLGIHGAIAFLLPLMPVDSNLATKQASKPGKSSVGVVDLTPAEKNRLPKVGVTPPVSLKSQLPGVPPLSGTPSQPGTTPNLNTSTDLAALPPTLPPLGVPLAPSNSLPSSTSVVNIPGVTTTPTSPLNISALPKEQLRITTPSRGQLPNSLSSTSPSSFRRRVTTPSRFNSRFDSSNISMGGSSSSFRTPNVENRIPPSSISEEPTTSQQDAILDTPAPSPSASIPFAPGAGNMVPPMDEGSRVATAPTAPTAPTNSTTENSGLAFPVGSSPKVGGDLALAPGNSTTVPPFPGSPEASSTTVPPFPGSLATSTTGTTGTPSSGIFASPSPTTSTALNSPENQQRVDKIQSLSTHAQKIREQFPNHATGKPILITASKPALQGKDIDGILAVDKDGKISYLGFSDESIPSDVREAARQSLREYFQANRPTVNGKPIQYTFRFSPNSGTVTTGTTETKPSSTGSTTAPQKLPNINTPEVSAPEKLGPEQGTSGNVRSGGSKPTDTTKPSAQQSVNFNRVTPLPGATQTQPFIGAPQVNNSPVTPPTGANVQASPLQRSVEQPRRLQQPGSQIRNEIRDRENLIVPTVQPSAKPDSETRSNTTSESSTTATRRSEEKLRSALRSGADQANSTPQPNNEASSSNNDNQNLIRRLRQVREERENAAKE